MNKIDSKQIKENIIALLNEYKVTYQLFQHDQILSYEDAQREQQKYGWTGTEGKSLVINADGMLLVYFTIQGQKVNFDKIKEILGTKKVRLATSEELIEYFGAVPGCAYPFGFDEQFEIYVDPAIYEQAWVIFSPCLPTFTVQAKGNELNRIFSNVKNKVTETNIFNL